MPTLDTLVARMHMEETNLKLCSGNTTEEALVMRFRNIIRGSHGRGRTWTDRNQVQPGRGDHSRGNFVNTSRSEIFYFRCNKPGHIARYCLAPASEVQQPFRPTLGAHLEEIVLDTFDESFQLALEALSLEDDAEWVIDSGASRHLSGNTQAFHSIDSSALAGSAVSAGGQNHPIQGQGTVNLPSPLGGIKQISSVYFVLGLNRNLLFVGQITELGCFVIFDEARCIALTKQKPCRIVARGKRDPKNGLYVLSLVSENLHMNLVVLQPSSFSLEANSCHQSLPIPSLATVKELPGRVDLELNSVSKISREASLWHCRMGHLSFPYLAQLNGRDVGLPLIPTPSNQKHCSSCQQGKNARMKFPKIATARAAGILDLIHLDLCGPLLVHSLGGSKYFVTSTDDFSRKIWIYFMVSKDQTFAKFRIFKSMIENLTGVKIKSIRTNGGREYTYGEFVAFCEQHGIRKEKTAAYSPHQNGLAERRNHSILEKTRSILLGAGAPAFLWAEVAKTDVYLLNHSSTKANVGGRPEEKFTGRTPSLRHLRVFGCMVFVHIPERYRNKLESRSECGVFVGYDDSTKGYRVYLPHKRTITVNRDERGFY
jgi:transposase InsO family protein